MNKISIKLRLLQLLITMHHKCLLIYNPQSESLQINLNNQQCELFANRLLNIEKASTVYIDNILHIIGSVDNNKHFISSSNQQTLHKIHTFNEFKVGISGNNLIHIPKKNIILMVCGMCEI